MSSAEAQKTVFVGMSGGVDSSVAAFLLKKAGYKVVGVFIKVWNPDFLRCNWEQERLDAMRVAAYLEIPFLTCDAEETYKHEVAEYFIREYKVGRTPNPDVMCNTHVKFGQFFAFAEQHGADYIATGHYAQVKSVTGTPTLFRGADTEKDQSYFLWNISKEALSKTLFPVGGYTKKQVREIAQYAGLPTALKSESQGICFLGHVDIPEFLSHYIDLKEGAVLAETGEIIGAHTGAELYTIGQRHGFHIFPDHAHTEPYFVSQKDVSQNTITVSHQKPKMVANVSMLTMTNVEWQGSADPAHISSVEVQTRYRQVPVRATLGVYQNGALPVLFAESGEAPAVGQSCVLYQGDQVLCGGIIDEIHDT